MICHFNLESYGTTTRNNHSMFSRLFGWPELWNQGCLPENKLSALRVRIDIDVSSEKFQKLKIRQDHWDFSILSTNGNVSPFECCYIIQFGDKKHNPKGCFQKLKLSLWLSYPDIILVNWCNFLLYLKEANVAGLTDTIQEAQVNLIPGKQ